MLQTKDILREQALQPFRVNPSFRRRKCGHQFQVTGLALIELLIGRTHCLPVNVESVFKNVTDEPIPLYPESPGLHTEVGKLPSGRSLPLVYVGRSGQRYYVRYNGVNLSVRDALDEFLAGKTGRRLHNRIHKIILFGSHAKGTWVKDPDNDYLEPLLLSTNKSLDPEIDNDIAVELGIAPMPLCLAPWGMSGRRVVTGVR